MNRLVRAVLALAITLVTVGLIAGPASGTWSIVGVDPETGEVGVAIASCVPASALGDLTEPLEPVALTPGHGAGVSQALLNSDVPPEMERLLTSGSLSASVIDSVTNPTFDEDFAQRQHAVVTSDGNAAGFTGSNNSAVALDQQASNVSAQGNILVSEDVILLALAAFEKGQDESLAARLVNALEAGSRAGGDSRCPGQTALFAQVVVATPDDDPNSPTVNLITTVNEGSGENPVDLLAVLYRSGATQGEVLNTTRSNFVFFAAAVALVMAALAIGVRRRRNSAQ
jgi:uncharacterized Ntn-hydrolase superfamily protein